MSSTRTACIALPVVMFAFALGACGDSSSGESQSSEKTPSAAEKAQDTVCAARDDMGKQVEELKGLTAATVTKDGVNQSLTAIKKDLNDIAGAQATLSSDRRSEVEAANTAFAASVKQIASQLGKSVSAADSKTGLVTALQQLETSYQQTFAALDCS